MVWRSTDAAERAKVVELIGRSYPAFRRDPERCVAEQLDLSFYPEGQGRLIRLSARDVPGSMLWYCVFAQKAVAMTQGMASVHDCNDAGSLMLTADNIHDYVRFYYYFAQGARLFESRVKRSAIGFSGKVWVFESKNRFVEIDANIAARGVVVELEKLQLHDVPPFEPGDFDL